MLKKTPITADKDRGIDDKERYYNFWFDTQSIYVSREEKKK